MDIEDIIKRVRTGDTTALKKLIEAYSPMLRKVCFNITHEDEDALNDLVQVAFIRAYYSLHQLRDASKFGEWVSAIAKNEALKFRKCKQKRSVVPFSSFSDEELDVEGSITPENYLGEKEIMDIVRQLPTGYSKVFQMAVIEGYSHKEIAERMGIEPHSSSSQLARAKAMLRKMISKRMLAVVTIIFISIPICRVLWRKDKAKEKNNHTAQVKNEDKGQTSLGNRQVEEKQATKDQITKDQSQKDKEVDVVISNIYPRVVQAIVDTIPATDTLQSPSTLDNIRIAGMLVLKHADAIGVLELSTDYTWSDAKESMTINANKGIYSLEQMETLTFQRKPHRFCGLPLEKVLMHVNVTAELFGRNNFQPLMQNNQVFTQGYYTAIKSFVDAVEGKRACNPQSLEAFMDTYSLLDTIRLHICRKVF